MGQMGRRSGLGQAHSCVCGQLVVEEACLTLILLWADSHVWVLARRQPDWDDLN